MQVFPTWQDVGVTPYLLDYVRSLRTGSILDYLILNRVFRHPVKLQFLYKCSHCRRHKKLYRYFEDYSTCEDCGSTLMSCEVSWRMGKDKVEPYSSTESLMSKVVQQMPNTYGIYFHTLPPDNFLTSAWSFDKESVKLPIHNQEVKQDEDAVDNGGTPTCSAQYLGGELVKGHSQIEVICKAAVLCPYLWDDSYDWKLGEKKFRGCETHIIPLLHLWSRYLSENGTESKKGSTRKSSPSVNPVWIPGLAPAPNGIVGGEVFINDQQADDNNLPAAIVDALQEDHSGIFHHIFGN